MTRRLRRDAGLPLPRVLEQLASLNEPAVSELDAAWSAEIAERLAAYDRGEVQAIPADEVLARVRALAK